MRIKQFVASALAVIVLTVSCVPRASASVGTVLYNATLGNIYDFQEAWLDDIHNSKQQNRLRTREAIRNFYDFWSQFYIDKTLDKAAFLEKLKNGDFGGDGSTTVTNSDVNLNLSFSVTDESLEAYQTQIDSGAILSISHDTGHFSSVLGSYSRLKSFYGDYTYYWEPPALTFASSSFTLPSDGVYEIEFDGIETLGRTLSGEGENSRYYYLHLQKEIDGAWVDSALCRLTSTSTSGDVLTAYTYVPYSSNPVSVSLVSGYKYRFTLYVAMDSYAAGNAPAYYYGFEPWIDVGGVSIGLSDNSTYVPAVTRINYFSQAINDYNALVVSDNDSYNNYFIGTTDENGDVIEVYDFNIFDESTMTIQNPASGDTWTATSWEYDYLSQSYYCTLENDQYVRITYGDEYVTIIYPDENGNYYEQNYYYVIAEYTVPENPDEPVCDHVFLSDTTIPPTCTESGWRSYTCSECGFAYNTSILAKGHDWVEVETVPPVTDEDGDVIEVGYTTFECSACGETTITYNGAIPDSGVPPVEDESWFKWFTGLFKKLISSIVNGLSSALEWVIEHLVMTVVDWLTRAADWVFGLFDTESLGLWFNWFEDGSALDEEFTQYDENGKEMEVDVWA